MTGESITVFPAPGYEALYWKDEWLSGLGMEQKLFPSFVAPGSLVGATRAAAVEYGLPEGIPVVAGGPDFLAALVGTATTRPGRTCDRAGTSEGLNLCAMKGIADPRLLSMPHIIRPFANISGTVSTSGKAVEWFISAMGLGGAREGDYEAFFAEAGRASAGSKGLLFLPYLAGERSPHWDSQGSRFLHRFDPGPWQARDGEGRPRIDGLRHTRHPRGHGGGGGPP